MTEYNMEEGSVADLLSLVKLSESELSPETAAN